MSAVVVRQIPDMVVRQISVKVVRNLEEFSISSPEAARWKI